MANLEKNDILEKIFADGGAPLTESEKARLGIGAMSTEESQVEAEEAEIDDDEIQSDGDGEEIADDTSVEPEAVEPVSVDVAKPTKNLDKKESKIISLKDERKNLLAENRALQAKLEAYELEKRRAELRSKFSEEHDDASAEILTETAINREQTAKQIETLTFMATNPNVMIKYPDARQEVDRIMALTKSTGATAEQVCEILFGQQEPLEVKRAKASVTGKLPKSPQDYSVNNAGNTTVAKARTALTAEQRDTMKELVQRGFTFESEAEFLRLTTH